MNSLHKKRWVILILFVVAVVTIISGFWLNDPVISNRLKGLGTVMIFFVVMPLFLLVESPRKKMKDYMLTEENIKKMQSDKKGSRKS